MNKRNPRRGRGGKARRARGRSRGSASQGLGDLLNPLSIRQGPDLLKLSHALTNLEVRPQIGAYQRLAREIGMQGRAESRGLSRLGRTSQRNVSSTYRNLAQSEAQNIARQNTLAGMLKGETQQIGQQAAAQQTASQTGELGGYLGELGQRGAPGGGSAQQALAAMVAGQQQRSAQEGAAQQGFAASQGAAYSQFASAQAASEQARGAEASRDITRDIASRIAESRLKTGQDVREAKGKIADLRSLKGASLLKNLTDLTKSDRDFWLGKQAVRQQGASLRADIAQNKRSAALDWAKLQQDARQYAQGHNLDVQQFKLDLKKYKQGASLDKLKLGLDVKKYIEDKKHHRATEQQAKKDSASGTGAGADRRDAAAAAATFGSGHSTADIEKHFSDFVSKIENDANVPFAVARRVAQRYLRRRKGRQSSSGGGNVPHPFA